MADKTDNSMEQAKGRAKETLGAATGNEDMKHEGRAEQSSSDLKQAGEKVKDAFKR